MKIPVWLLRLLPMWDYICPKCRKTVKKNSHKCVHCGEQYGCPVRVPPRILKDTKALENYVHRHIFPKISKAQRDYLVQFFTELFSDGFESGNFSQWTGTSGSPTIVESPVHHGDYAAEINATNEGIYKQFTEQTTVYFRFYVRFNGDVGDTDGNRWYFAELCHDSPGYGSYIVALARRNSGGTKYWALVTLESGGWTYRAYSTTPAFVVNQWYCIEIKAVIDNASGEYRVYFDGVENTNLQRLNKDTDDRGNINIASLKYDSVSGTVPTATFDCVVVADTYIGPETMEQTYTKTWTTDALFKKLGIQKSLNVDTAFQKRGNPKTFSLDAAFQKNFTTQKQIGALFKRNDVPKSFVVDACFGALATHTIARQIDVVLKKLAAAKTFGLDVYFGAVEGETCSVTFGLSARFAYKVRLPELWLDENGKIVLNVSKPYTWVGT